jgi:hypothetical protein
MKAEICAATSGVACVLGISLSVVNAWLTAISLAVSIAAGVVSLALLIQKVAKNNGP